MSSTLLDLDSNNRYYFEIICVYLDANRKAILIMYTIML